MFEPATLESFLCSVPPVRMLMDNIDRVQIEDFDALYKTLCQLVSIQGDVGRELAERQRDDVILYFSLWAEWVSCGKQVFEIADPLREALYRSTKVLEIPLEDLYFPFGTQYINLEKEDVVSAGARGKDVRLMGVYTQIVQPSENHFYYEGGERRQEISDVPVVTLFWAFDGETEGAPIFEFVAEKGMTVKEAIENFPWLQDNDFVRDSVTRLLRLVLGALVYATTDNGDIIEELSKRYRKVLRECARFENKNKKRAARAKRELSKLYMDRKKILGRNIVVEGEEKGTGTKHTKATYVCAHTQGYWKLVTEDTHPNAPRKLSKAGKELALHRIFKAPFWKGGERTDEPTRRVLK